jgi:hypothetical protein
MPRPCDLSTTNILNGLASYFHRALLHTLDPLDEITEILVYMLEYPILGFPIPAGLYRASAK